MINPSRLFKDAPEIKSVFKPLIPPIKVEGDVTEITGFVEGVQVKSATYNDKSKNFIVQFADINGHVISKFFEDPDFNNDISEDQKYKRYEGAVQDVRNIWRDSSVIDEIIASGNPVDFKTWTEKIWEPIVGNFKDDAVLKVLFSQPNGEEPKYVLPMFGYLSTKWHVENGKFKFNTEGQYPDRVRFTKIKKTPTEFENNVFTPNESFDPSSLDSLLEM